MGTRKGEYSLVKWSSLGEVWNVQWDKVSVKSVGRLSPVFVKSYRRETRGFNLKGLEMFCDVCCLFFVNLIFVRHQQLGNTFNTKY